jgi:hypothetical protein
MALFFQQCDGFLLGFAWIDKLRGNGTLTVKVPIRTHFCEIVQ